MPIANTNPPQAQLVDKLVDDIYESLCVAHGKVEAAVWLVEDIVAKGDADAANIDPVTLEQIGVVASTVSDVDRNLRDLAGLRARLATGVDQLTAIRSVSGTYAFDEEPGGDG